VCGVAGVINSDGRPVELSDLRRMTDSIQHRGPDGEGHWQEDSVGLGHRRLSIIDLTDSGSQPMVSQDGRHVLSYNGEIYNFKELRAELVGLGRKFRGESDTEVVLNALAEWGTGALLKFNGMFALALWDRSQKTMLLARDRYGVKPLYYSMEGNRFSFASEQKAITALPGFKKTLNQEALLEYFTFQNIFTDMTFVQGVKILPAGAYGVFQHGHKNFEISKYWDFDFQEPENALSEHEYLEELGDLLGRAVRRQLVSDVEVGSYLSGGIDSGTITGIASHNTPDLKTFTIGFDLNSASGLELAFDERQKAEALSGVFKTEHYERVLKSGDMASALPILSYHLEEPRVGQSYPNFYAAKLASRFVKVVLSGTGGDELFGGYPWRYFVSESKMSFDQFVDEYYVYWQRLVSNSELKQLFAPIWGNVKDISTRDIFKSVLSGHPGGYEKPQDFLHHSMYLEAKTFLHGLLVVEDKLSMAHGLESRVPFLDNDLVEFAMKVPAHLKVKRLLSEVKIDENLIGNKSDGFTAQHKDGKAILRRVASSFLPEIAANSVKQGFSGPDASWFKGESIQFLKSKILDKNSALLQVFDKSKLHGLTEEHLSGARNRRLLIWSFLNLEQLLGEFS
jgi:asparagine synthase (glutamine-hydrolysing)